MNSLCPERNRWSIVFVAVAVAAGLLLLPAGPADAAREKGMRRALAKPMQEVQALIEEANYEAALKQIDEAESAVEEPTPYESYVLDRLRGSAATGANDYGTAIEAYRRVLNSAELPDEERPAILNATARMAYTAKRYDEAIELIRAYRKAGGEDRQTLSLLPQALYVTDRYAEAAEELLAQIEKVEKTGGKPPEFELQLLSSAQVKNGDIGGYLETLYKSVLHYPSEEYWDELIGSTVDYFNLPSRLMLHIYRLRQWTGTLDTASDYMEATQAALQDGYPHEAQQFISQGFEAGELGSGTPTEINRHRRLQEHVGRKVVEDKRLLAEGERLAKQKPNGDPLVNTGFNYLTYGRYEKGLSLMRDGLDRGALRHPEEAKLLYGYGLLLAGRSDVALDVFSGIDENSPAYRLARLWKLAVRHDGPP